MKNVVLGTGSWGCALAQVLADNGEDVTIWGKDQSQIDEINTLHHNYKYYDDPIHPGVKATSDISLVADADMILLAIPSMAIEEVLSKIKTYIHKKPIIINVAKGFHPISHDRLSNVIRKFLPNVKRKAIVSLIGPSHAEEVIARKLTAINAVSVDEESAKYVQNMFSNAYFRVYRNNDEIGAEIGAALKNIMAIAAGISEGVGQGVNARAALITRGLAEMTRFGVAQGGKKETFLGLDGVGDLVVTCTSNLSRNFMAGYTIGQAGSAKEFLTSNKKTVEGVFACKIVYEEALKQNIDMPITNAVYQILYENRNPKEVIEELMARDLKRE